MQAREKAENDLWEAAGLTNPTKRGGHEIRDQQVHDNQGNTLITVQLWKKIDEKRVQLSVDVKAKTVEQKEDSDIGDLLS